MDVVLCVISALARRTITGSVCMCVYVVDVILLRIANSVVDIWLCSSFTHPSTNKVYRFARKTFPLSACRQSGNKRGFQQSIDIVSTSISI